MKKFVSEGRVGFNPLLRWVINFRGEKQYSLYIISEQNELQAALNIILCFAAFSVAAFSSPFAGFAGYGLLMSVLLYIYIMARYVKKLYKAQRFVRTKPKAIGYAPSIFVLEWVIIFVSGTLLILFGGQHSDSFFLKLVAVITAIFAFLPLLPFRNDPNG